MSGCPFVLPVCLILVVAGAAAYDCKYRKIPNWFNLSALVLGFGLNLLLRGTPGLVSACQGLVLALAIYLPLYLMRGMGAGDVKLMAAVGCLVGPVHWFEIFFATSVLGGFAAVLFAMGKKRLGETCWNLFGIIHDLSRFRAPYLSNPQLDVRNPRALRMPHALTIALGAIAFLALTASSTLPLAP